MKFNLQIFKAYTKSYYLYLVFVLVMSLVLQRGQASELDDTREIWKEERYEEAAIRLENYRKQPKGKNAEVDYMLATSYSRTDGYEEIGKGYFLWMLKHYILGVSKKDSVQMEKRKSVTEAKATQPIMISFLEIRHGEAGINGKFYHVLKIRGKAIAHAPLMIVETKTSEELEKRLFAISARDSAIEFVKNLLGDRYRVHSKGHFVVASRSNHTVEQLDTICQDLEDYLNFYERMYRLPASSYLITVYLSPDTRYMGQLARKIHGYETSELCIGYSNPDDLSIVAAIPRMTYGTLTHELFHLMVRLHFGDIPPWLNEGLASLYEVSEKHDDSIVGLPNWRGWILKEFWDWDRCPSIAELVTMDAHTFHAVGTADPAVQAVNHAMARYFILSLQQRRVLFDVYDLFRNRRPSDLVKDTGEIVEPGMDAINLLEDFFDVSIEDLNSSWRSWCFDVLVEQEFND